MNYFEVYQAVWQFHKKYVDVQNSDEYWAAVCSEHGQIIRQFNKPPFVRALCMAVVSELEAKAKEKRQ